MSDEPKSVPAPVVLDEETLRIIEEYERMVERAKAPKRIKNAWIALARRCFDPGDREPCAVCGKFRVIAEAHHVVPLEAQYDRGYSEPDHGYIWLCPNHHQMVHVFLKRVDRRVTLTFADNDLSDKEFDAIQELFKLSAKGSP